MGLQAIFMHCSGVSLKIRIKAMMGGDVWRLV